VLAVLTVAIEERTPPVNVIAKTLWQVGNDRIGHREWADVGHIYKAEALIVVDELAAAGWLLVEKED
jgi:hypothetical protein